MQPRVLKVSMPSSETDSDPLTSAPSSVPVSQSSTREDLRRWATPDSESARTSVSTVRSTDQLVPSRCRDGSTPCDSLPPSASPSAIDLRNLLITTAPAPSPQPLQLILPAAAAPSRRCRLPDVSGLPPQLGGMALNLCGIAGLVKYLGGDDVPLGSRDVWGELGELQLPLLCLSLVLQALTLYRMLRHWELVRHELQTLPFIASVSPFLLALQLSLQQLHGLGHMPHTAANTVTHALAAIEMATLLYFLRCAIARRATPEPFWWPPLLMPALWASDGGALLGPSFARAGLIVCVAIGAIIYPPCMWNVLTKPRKCANDPGIFAMLGPVAFLALGALSLEGTLPMLGPTGGDVVFGLVMGGGLLVFGAAFRRRAALGRALCGGVGQERLLFGSGGIGGGAGGGVVPRAPPPAPISLAWTAFTFPIVTNARVALLFAEQGRVEGAPVLAHDLTANVAAAWGSVLLLLSLLVVPILDVLLLASLPRWLATPLPPPASPRRAAENAAATSATSLSSITVAPAPLSSIPDAATIAINADGARWSPPERSDQFRLSTRSSGCASAAAAASASELHVELTRRLSGISLASLGSDVALLSARNCAVGGGGTASALSSSSLAAPRPPSSLSPVLPPALPRPSVRMESPPWARGDEEDEDADDSDKTGKDIDGSAANRSGGGVDDAPGEGQHADVARQIEGKMHEAVQLAGLAIERRRSFENLMAAAAQAADELRATEAAERQAKLDLTFMLTGPRHAALGEATRHELTVGTDPQASQAGPSSTP